MENDTFARIPPDEDQATVEDTERRDAAGERNVQYIQHATVVNQYGKNCVSVAHVDRLSL